MSEPAITDEKKWSFPLPFNYATGIFFLVFLIPLLYTVFANLQKPSAPAVITRANELPVLPVVTPARQLENALKAVADNPGASSYIALGMVYYSQSQYDEGIKAWKKAIEYNPQSEIAYNDIAAAYGALHKWDDEIKAAQKALAINPNFDLAKRNLAWQRVRKMRNSLPPFNFENRAVAWPGSKPQILLKMIKV